MKFEAKDVSGVAISQASGTPYVNITQQGARANCSAFGNNYHLITDNEWLTIAHNVEIVSSNWNSSVVGSGFLFSGHNDNSPASALDVIDENDYYDSTLNSTPSNQRRVLILNNGEVVWDLAGNVWEWTNDTISIASRYHGGDQGWMSYSNNDGTGKIASNLPILKLPISGYNANQGMGRYLDGFNLSGAYNNINESPDFCTGFCSPTAVFARGGRWTTGASATGVFTLTLDSAVSLTGTGVGFRCSYTP